MIEFLQDYQTQAKPPETFAKGERVERSEASELYFVSQGVAGFVVNDRLFDQDYNAIVPATVVLATTTAPLTALAGRGGELPLTVAAPGQATTGPGNAVMFGGDQQTVVLGTEIERLTAELAEANAEGDDAAVREGELLEQINALTAERDSLREQVNTASQAVTDANTRADEADKLVSSLRDELAAAHQALDAATQPPAEQAAEATAEPAEEKPVAKSKAK